MSHTPGPWRIERKHGDRVLHGATGWSLMGDTQYYPWVPDSEDDWSLIAAAPELLAELIRLVEAYQDSIDYEDREDLLALIAKATGKEAL